MSAVRVVGPVHAKAVFEILHIQVKNNHGEDVADAAVVGIPSDEWGETVAAAIVLKPNASASTHDLQHLVKTTLRSSRVPEAILVQTELPYNETGKLLRRVVQQLFA